MDADNPKARGRKHLANKSKYKPKPFKQSHEQKQRQTHEQRPRLESNWDRYDIDDGNGGHELTNSTNFELLASAPITQGSYFQFRKDRSHDVELPIENSQGTTDLFSLNLDALNESIATIPFPKRCGISQDYFSDNQIKYLETAAVDNLGLFKSKYSERLAKRKKIVKLAVKDPSVANEKECFQDEDTSDAFVEALINPVNDVLSLKTPEAATDKKSELANEKPSSSPGTDLESWLDDILAS